MVEFEGTLTWLGHSTFLLETGAGTRVLIDPFLEHNPRCPDAFHGIDSLDLILVTHGHADHVVDCAALAERTGAPVVAQPELCAWLQSKGVTHLAEMNKGGTQEIAGLRISMVDASHSSSFVEDDGTIVYLGEPTGYVIELENGYRIYHAGDTCVFPGMALIGELYRPHLALLPIGDHYTMGPREAAKAVELLAVRDVIGMHWGTFPVLVGTPEQLAARVAPGVTVHQLQPGDVFSAAVAAPAGH